MMMTAQRIGLFGGSFDPVHNGHVMLADTALKELSLDKLYLIPAAQSPFKPDEIPAGNGARAELLGLAFGDSDDYGIDEQELKRGGISYTIDTVRDHVLRASGAEFFYLIGADHVPTLPKWRDAAELAKLTSFAAVPRPGEIPSEFPTPFTGHWLKGIPIKISSSDIRKRVRKKCDFENLVPSAVAKAIHNMNLYAN